MKKIKGVVCMILFAAGFLFNGELYIFYLDNFQNNYYYAAVSFQKVESDVTDGEIAEDFLKTAERYDVDFFMVNNKIKSSYETDIEIYGTQGALEYLADHEIAPNEYTSLFVGRTRVCHMDFSQVENIRTLDYCYFLGDESQYESMRQFKADLMERYDGNLPKPGQSYKELYLNLLSVWIPIFAVLLLMTMYEVFLQKKENAVRVVMGEDLRRIFFLSTIKDIGVFLIVFVAAAFLLRGISNTLFLFKTLGMVFAGFLLLSLAVNVGIFRVDFKKDLAGSRDSRKLLRSSYALNLLTSVMAILVLTGNFAVIAQGVDLYRQHDFFEQHKGYSYYQLNYKIGQEPELEDGEDPDCVINQIFQWRFQDRSLEYVDMTPHFGNTYPVILMNSNSMKEQTEMNSFLADAVSHVKENEVYLLIPEGLSVESETFSLVEQTGLNFFSDWMPTGENGKEYVISYKGDVEMLRTYYSFPFRSKMTKNPVILFDNTSGEATNRLYYAYDIMYDIEESELGSFIEEFDLENQIVVQSNVWDVYQYSLTGASRSMRICLALSLLLLGLQLALILFIIRLEYRVNSMEMALKKVMGYNRYERNQRIFAGTITVSVIGMIVSVVLSLVWELEAGVYLLMSILILAVLETICVITGAQHKERAQVVRILKGDHL